ncbi:MAG TPA: hypothetical protein VGC08_07000 [Pedobacter sp.]
MNNTFNINRFLKLFNKHTKEHYGTYLMSTAVLTGILIVVMGMTAYSSDGFLGTKAQAVFFDLFLLFSSTIFTSMVFDELGNKKKAIPAMTLPVSHFERYLVGWIYSFIIFQLVFLACFFGVAAAVINIGNNNPHVHNELLKLDPEVPEIYMAYIFFILLHAVTLLGAIAFEKLHFIKTAFALFAFLVIIVLINNGMIHMIFNENVHSGAPFEKVFVEENHVYYQVKANESGNTIAKIMVFSTVILLWAAAYFRLKEKQV